MNQQILNIFYLNVRSLLPKIADIEFLLNNIKIDILCISETWLTGAIGCEIVTIAGYNFVGRDRSARGGGVGIYIRSNLQFTLLNYSDNIEQLWISITLRSSKLVVGVAYKLPILHYKPFLDEIENSIAYSMQISDKIILGGDFNINFLKLNDASVVYLGDILDSVGGDQLITSPTRLSLQSLSLLDIIITTDKSVICDSGVIDSTLSDHDIIYCQVSIRRPSCNPCYLYKRKFNKINIQSFNDDLQRIPFQNIFHLRSVDDVNFLNSATIYAPLRLYRFTKPRMPWITDNIRLLITIRDKAKAKFRRTGKPQHWDYYKMLRNFTTSCIHTQ